MNIGQIRKFLSKRFVNWDFTFNDDELKTPTKEFALRFFNHCFERFAEEINQQCDKLLAGDDDSEGDLPVPTDGNIYERCLGYFNIFETECSLKMANFQIPSETTLQTMAACANVITHLRYVGNSLYIRNTQGEIDDLASRLKKVQEIDKTQARLNNARVRKAKLEHRLKRGPPVEELRKQLAAQKTTTAIAQRELKEQLKLRYESIQQLLNQQVNLRSQCDEIRPDLVHDQSVKEAKAIMAHMQEKEASLHAKDIQAEQRCKEQQCKYRRVETSMMMVEQFDEELAPLENDLALVDTLNDNLKMIAGCEHNSATEKERAQARISELRITLSKLSLPDDDQLDVRETNVNDAILAKKREIAELQSKLNLYQHQHETIQFTLKELHSQCVAANLAIHQGHDYVKIFACKVREEMSSITHKFKTLVGGTRALLPK